MTRTVQIEFMGESDAPVIEILSAHYEPDFLVVHEKDSDGRIIRHTFPWCNIRTVREWIEDGE